MDNFIKFLLALALFFVVGFFLIFFFLGYKIINKPIIEYKATFEVTYFDNSTEEVEFECQYKWINYHELKESCLTVWCGDKHDVVCGIRKYKLIDDSHDIVNNDIH